MQDELQDFPFAQVLVLGHHALANGLVANDLGGNTRAIVDHPQHHVTTFAGQRQRHFAGLRLAVLLAVGRLFDAVVQCVTQHVLQRRDHALEDVAVHFPFRVADIELDFLAELAADLTDNPAQPGHHGGKRNHPGLHQTFLEFRVDPRLLYQQGLGVPNPVGQGFPQIRKVRR